jgi:hypothetical protein
MNALLMIISVLLVIAGGMMLSQATTGVGLICIGIAFAVWCRINQAAVHRTEDIKRWAKESIPVVDQGA